MIGMLKTFAVVGAVGASALMANSARADHVSVGFGISVPAVRYAAPVVYQPTYVAPAPVVTYAAPTYAYTPGYCPPTVTYVAPPTVVYSAPPVVYSSPVYSSPVYAAPVYTTPVYEPYYEPYYYSRPSFGFNIGFGFGGHDRDDHGGYHGGGGGGHRR